MISPNALRLISTNEASKSESTSRVELSDASGRSCSRPYASETSTGGRIPQAGTSPKNSSWRTGSRLVLFRRMISTHDSEAESLSTRLSCGCLQEHMSYLLHNQWQRLYFRSWGMAFLNKAGAPYSYSAIVLRYLCTYFKCKGASCRPPA
jgi:hypothetical protein